MQEQKMPDNVANTSETESERNARISEKSSACGCEPVEKSSACGCASAEEGGKERAGVCSAGTSPEREAKFLGAAEMSSEKPAERKESSPKKRKKNWLSFLVSAAIIVCVMFALLQLNNTLEQGDSATFAELIAGMNWWYILLAVGVFILMYTADTLKYVLLTRCYGTKLGIGKCMKVALIGKYYENITPTATGGQPMQIYYFYKNGISGAQSSSITFMKYGVQMIAIGIVCAILMGSGVGTLGMVENEAMRKTILICGWIGFGINAFIPFVVAFVIFCPRAVSWTINLFIKLLHKIKIIKNADKMGRRVQAWLDRFAEFSQFIVKHPQIFFLLLLLCLVHIVLEYVMPCVLLIAMLGSEVVGMQGWELWFTVAVLACYATNSAVFIPTPGNSGAIETVFMLAFTAVASSVLFWYVLVWRFMLYYSYIVLGIGMNIFDLGIKLRDARRERRAANEAERR